jgi:parallel beta-helix repeat protein
LNTEDNILIAGMGMDLTIVQNSSSAAADTEPFSFTNCDNLYIRDMTVSAGGTARSTSDAIDLDDSDECVIERVKVIASRGDGIVIDGKDPGAQAVNNVIRDCIVTGVNLCGIQLLTALRTKVVNCEIYSCSESGIKLNRSVAQTNNCLDTIIQGCSIHDNTEAGIEILECERSIIIGNQIFNNGNAGTYDDGIVIDDFATAGIATADNVIMDNLIFDDQGTPSQDYGININDALVTGTIVKGNRIFGHATGPIRDIAADTLIRDNLGAPDNSHQEVTSATTLTASDAKRIINAYSTGGAFTVTLPDNAAAEGRGFIIRREGTNNVTVARAGADTIDGAGANKTLGSDEAAIGLFSIGDGDWKVVSTEGTVT